jgi:hypothetical protein
MFMSAAPATAALPNTPDPPADLGVVPGVVPAVVPPADPAVIPAASRVPAQSCAARLVSLLRKLIDYGHDLARTVQQRAAAGTLVTVMVHFGTKDCALILARITRGLMLANALEARLASHPVRPDTEPAPDAEPAPDTEPAAVRAPAEGARRTARRAVPRPSLPDLPTAEEIAAALRHRPAAAVIADICRDLGIVPAHPLWGEVMLVLSGHGGNFVTFWNDVMERMFRWRTDASEADADGWPASPSHPVAACGTGPP